MNEGCTEICSAGALWTSLAAFTATLVQGKPEYTKKEKTACVTCHVKSGSKELNDVGKCYEKKKSLNGCKDTQKE